jgi:D-xylonolactonase
MEATPVWALAASLGEGPLWAEDTRHLWFTDIEGRALQRFDPATGRGERFPVDGRPGFIVRASDGGFVVGIERALRRWDGEVLGKLLGEVPEVPGIRLNDATVDARGRLWFGSMDAACVAPTGAVHLYDGGLIRTVGGRCAITNGPAVTRDGRTMYHVDTAAGRIVAFDIASRDMLENGRVFAVIDPVEGAPDGVTLDVEDCLWVALWGGWGVRRYDPLGVPMQTVRVPCAQATKIAFGGEDLRTAYVTTARTGLSEADLMRQPLAGGVFAFPAPAPGLPANRLIVGR